MLTAIAFLVASAIWFGLLAVGAVAMLLLAALIGVVIDRRWI